MQHSRQYLNLEVDQPDLRQNCWLCMDLGHLRGGELQVLFRLNFYLQWGGGVNLDACMKIFLLVLQQHKQLQMQHLHPKQHPKQHPNLHLHLHMSWSMQKSIGHRVKKMKVSVINSPPPSPGRNSSETVPVTCLLLCASGAGHTSCSSRRLSCRIHVGGPYRQCHCCCCCLKC